MLRFIFLLFVLAGIILTANSLKEDFTYFIKKGLEKNNFQNKPQNTLTEESDDFADEESTPSKVSINKKNNSVGIDNISSNDNQNFKVQFTQNPNTQQVKKTNYFYEYSYTFRNPQNKGVNLQWKTLKSETDKAIKEFGLPLDFFDVPKNQKEYEQIYQKSYYTQYEKDGKVYAVPDYNRLAKRHKPFTLPVFKAIKKSLGKTATPTQLIENLMTFYQDIPYKVPPIKRGKKLINGLDVPAKLFTRKLGDCDTKSLALVSTLLHQPSIKCILVMVTNPDHMFVAIRGVPTAYQTSITYQGQKYIVCEPVGPARLKIGELAFKDCKTTQIFKIENN